jgi:hypothetical protein
MKLAFIDHSYHRHTQSSSFFLELLNDLGSVTVFWDEGWRGRQNAWASDFSPDSFDCVIVYQNDEALRYIDPRHSNVVFVPMYDHIRDRLLDSHGDLFRSQFSFVKILCFSSTVYRFVQRFSGRAAWFQYFPDPDLLPSVASYDPLRGYFWKRVSAIDEAVLAVLCSDARFDRFTIHEARDPGQPPSAGLTPLAFGRSAPKVTHWSGTNHKYLTDVAGHNVYFASRPCEGIGMAFLEAMAMGLCVVAPDTPTHNEYVTPATGILYDYRQPSPLRFDAVRDCGLRARDFARRGYLTWRSRRDEVLSFISA